MTKIEEVLRTFNSLTISFSNTNNLHLSVWWRPAYHYKAHKARTTLSGGDVGRTANPRIPYRDNDRNGGRQDYV